MELARETALSAKDLAKLKTEQTNNKKNNDKINEILRKLGVAESYGNRMKYRLWEDLDNDPSGRCCPLSGKAISLDLQFFEDPVFYDNMQNARRRADSSALAIMNAILQIVQQTITLVSLVALLVGFSPWLAVVVIFAAIPNFISRSRFSEMAFRALTRRAPESRLLNYIETLLTSNETV